MKEELADRVLALEGQLSRQAAADLEPRVKALEDQQKKVKSKTFKSQT